MKFPGAIESLLRLAQHGSFLARIHLARLHHHHRHSFVAIALMLLLQIEQLPLVSAFWNHYMKIALPPSTSEIQFMQHDLTSHGTIDLGLLFFKTGDGSDVTNKTVSSFVSDLFSYLNASRGCTRAFVVLAPCYLPCDVP